MLSDDVPNLSARHLRAVLILAENRSFIAAATALKLSQPALTRLIKQVESLLGVELFLRTTRRVTVTTAGKDFAAMAERLLGDFKLGVGNLRKHATALRGQVIVSSVLPLGEPQLPSILAAFRRRYPEIDLQLREGMHEFVVDDVRTGVADFGIGYINGLASDFVAEALGIETLHVVFPTSHPWARLRKIPIAQLSNADLVSYPSDARTRRLVDSLAAKAGVAPRHRVVVGRLSTLNNMVRGGLGVALVPSSERPAAADRQITSRPLAHAPITRLGVFYLRDRGPNPIAIEFLSLIKEWIRVAAPKKLRAAKRK